MVYRFIFCLLFLSSIVNAQPTLRNEISYEFLDKLIEKAKENYPKVKMYDSKIQFGEFGVKRAKLSYFDAISFSYLLNPSQIAASVNPNVFNSYQFGFFFNIGTLLQKPMLIKQYKSELEALNLDKDTYLRSLETEVKTRYYSYVQSIVLYKIKQNALLDSEGALEDMRHKFERGEVELNSLNDATNAYSDLLQVNITAETNVLIAKTGLEELVGQNIDDLK